MLKEMQIQQEANMPNPELEMYASLDNSEVGELCLLLLDLRNRFPYFLTKELSEVIDKEIEAQLNNYKDYCEIVEKTETITRTFKELDWDWD